MKLAALAVVTLLGLGGAAHAEPASAPGPTAEAGPAPRAQPAPRVAVAHPRSHFHELLFERFDRNHDGQLDPDERRRAARTLRKLARRIEALDRTERAAARNRRLIRRYDTNGDGVVSPEEMPPGVARKLQPLDRNGDGSLDARDRK